MSTVALAAKSTSTYAALSASAGVVVANGTTSSSTPIVVLPLTQLLNATNIVSGTLANAQVTSALSSKTYNGMTIVANSGSLQIANAKTFNVAHSITLDGSDGSTLNIGSGGTLTSSATTANTTAATASTLVARDSGAGITGATGTFSHASLGNFFGTQTVSSVTNGSNVTMAVSGGVLTVSASGGGGGSLPLQTGSDPGNVLLNSAGTPILATTASGGLSLGGAAPTVLNEPLAPTSDSQVFVQDAYGTALFNTAGRNWLEIACAFAQTVSIGSGGTLVDVAAGAAANIASGTSGGGNVMIGCALSTGNASTVTIATGFPGNGSIKVGDSSASIGFFGASPITKPSANQAMTDSTGGTPSTSLAACGDTTSSDQSGTINNNFASLNARLAELRSLLTGLGLGS